MTKRKPPFGPWETDDHHDSAQSASELSASQLHWFKGTNRFAHDASGGPMKDGMGQRSWDLNHAIVRFISLCQSITIVVSIDLYYSYVFVGFTLMVELMIYTTTDGSLEGLHRSCFFSAEEHKPMFTSRTPPSEIWTVQQTHVSTNVYCLKPKSSW